MKRNCFEKADLFGAVATFNADPFCIETEDVLDSVWSHVIQGFHLILDDYDSAVAQLDLDPNFPYEIYESDDCMVKFCLL